ncbi:Phage regulatory protein Rha (Phage pRha) [Bartonella sp. WD16.2]|nr:Phage regulatory protein Rha (Phage pRha) [Bartonella sp. WD16.2]
MNNLVKNPQTTLTISSREIADLCGKQHTHIMRDIRKILGELYPQSTQSKFGLSDFASSYKDSTGRILPCFNLPKRECLILISGYSTVLRAKIIDRWMELEGQLQLDHDRNTQFDLQNYYLESMGPGEKAWYILGPVQARLVEAFKLVEEGKHYKTLVEEAKRVLEDPVAKAA